MIFTETGLKDAFIVEPELKEDDRGFFARAWCRREFQKQGVNSELVQCNISFNKKRGTLRGMHFQAAPHQEAKLVRCSQGAIHDVIIDLRPQSATFKRHFAISLTSLNRLMLYVPEDFAHGFLTLEDNTEVFYQMSQFFFPGSARGIRWDDPAFSIPWPIPISVISKQDESYPDFV